MRVTIELTKRTVREAKALACEAGPFIAAGCHCVGCVILRKVRAQIRRQQKSQ